MIDELGGSALPGGEGIEPDWVRVGLVELEADAGDPSGTYVLAPSATGVAALARGIIGWRNIALGAVSVDGAGIPGDVNGDGLVDVQDLVEVVLSWGQCLQPPRTCPADLNDDGVVAVQDLIEVILNWT